MLVAIFLSSAGRGGSTPLRVTPELQRFADSGPCEVRSGEVSWTDHRRGLEIHAHIYYPASAGLHPLAIFSHGLGNSSRGYRYLGEHWASWGIIAVHLDHPGAGADLARRGWIALYRAGFDRRLWRTTVDDVHFALDQLLDDQSTPPFLSGRIDKGAIGIAGHSLGAYVALATAGAVHQLPDGEGASLRDARISCAIALSMSENLSRASYGSTNVPILHVTGTRDSSLFYGTTRAMRRIPFDESSGGPAMLMVIKGANHSTFSADNRTAEEARLTLIKATSVLWWQAWLQHDGRALQMLERLQSARPLAATVETRGFEPLH